MAGINVTNLVVMMSLVFQPRNNKRAVRSPDCLTSRVGRVQSRFHN
jgi:hypothetical protein